MTISVAAAVSGDGKRSIEITMQSQQPGALGALHPTAGACIPVRQHPRLSHKHVSSGSSTVHLQESDATRFRGFMATCTVIASHGTDVSHEATRTNAKQLLAFTHTLLHLF